MLRSQRIIIIIGLALIAWLLHVNMCDWAFRRLVTTYSTGGGGRYTLICGWATEPVASTRTPAAPMPPNISMVDVHVTGLLAQQGISRREAMLVGIVLPVAMLTAALCLWLGVRHAGRIARGLCANCGYDLKGSPDAAKCPECGAGTS